MASSTAPPTATIIELKTAFLRRQTLALSQSFRVDEVPPEVTAEERGLRERAVDNALEKLNGLLRKHNKLAYGPQALRHIAEQIDRLYWGGEEVGGGDDLALAEGEEWLLHGGVDYRKSTIISQLPEEWSEDAEGEKAEKFKTLQQRLVGLNERRNALREKVESYRQMKKLLEPFEKEAVQENLVSRDGEVEQELQRMRMLMLRVERGVVGLRERGPGERDGDADGEEGDEVEGVEGKGEEMDVDIDEEQEKKLLALLGGR